MIAKQLISGYDTSTAFPASVLLPAFSKGFDKDTLHKEASMFEDMYDAFERKPGHTYIHLISVAAGEQYGPNSRADFYNGHAYEVTFPYPEKGGRKAIMLDGGIEKYHSTFDKEGGVYTEHRSGRDGYKPQGYIVVSGFNKDMQRGELIIGVKTDAWRADIEKLSNGTPLRFSIGADALADHCSLCGHKATTESGHCDHYKNERGVIYDDGIQQYVISDNLVFHDISRVRNPAEKIAFSIRKVASNGLGFEYTDETLKPHLSSVPYMLKTAKARKKFDTLKKLSKIEKKIIAESEGGVLDPGLVSMFHTKNAKSSADSLCKFLRYAQDENELIGALNEKGVLLSPEEFATVFVPEDTKPLIHMDDYKAAIPGIFNDLLGRDDVEVICSDETYDPKPCKNGLIIQAVIDYKNDGGFSPEDAIDEALGQFLSGVELHSESPRIIVCKKRCKGVSDALAEEYANYMLSSADNLSPDALTAALLRAII